MDRQVVISAFGLMEKVENLVYDKLKAIDFRFDSASITGVTEHGVEVSTQYMHCGGCGTDYDNFTFTWDELEMDNETYKAHNKEQKAIRKAQKEAEEKAQREAEKKAKEIAKEEKDRRDYERLRAKFEGA